VTNKIIIKAGTTVYPTISGHNNFFYPDKDKPFVTAEEYQFTKIYFMNPDGERDLIPFTVEIDGRTTLVWVYTSAI
jgi:hypothetical protein